ncbi:hypothetical protein GCM10018954_078240 [Kutzneria kofuensis]
MVSDHVCFVRAGGLDAGHLMPLPRTRDALDVLVANVQQAQQTLPVPLALENVAALIDWPGAEMTEGQFLAELVERTDCRLLVDVANLYAKRPQHRHRSRRVPRHAAAGAVGVRARRRRRRT